MSRRKKYGWLAVGAVLVILIASFMAMQYQTSFGKVKVTEVSYVSEDGAVLRGLLYVPKAVNGKQQAPGIVAAHGYNNTAEVQGMNSIELSKRGYVVFAVDEYGHGKSAFPDERIEEGIVPDLGVYSALQYLANLPYVDRERIGMVGHSMGGGSIQSAALRAYQESETDSEVALPKALLPTAQAFSVDENREYLLKDYPINIGIVNGQYDEWTNGFWEVELGKDVNRSYKIATAMAVDLPEYNTFYRYGENTPIKMEEVDQVVEEGALRIIYSVPSVHPRMHFSKEASTNVINFFDTTLTNPNSEMAATKQSWLPKDIFSGIALLALFVLTLSVGMLLLEMPFFATVTRQEPESFIRVGGKQTAIYLFWFILAALPAPIIYQLVSGYPIAIKASNRAVPTLFPPNAVFPMPTANVLTVFNVLTTLVTGLIFVFVYQRQMKRAGATLSSIGFSLPIKEILKALLLATLTFLASYMIVALVESLFLVDFRFYVFSIKTLTLAKWPMFLAYLPFFMVTFLTSSLLQNAFTRIAGKKEWLNVLLIVIASVWSLLMLTLLDYSWLYLTGVKLFPTLPLPEPVTSALAGVLLWGLLFILPISAWLGRLFFKRTGSIWVGGFINAFIVTLYAISNTVVAAGLL